MKPFVSAPNKFAALSAHDAMVNVSAALRSSAGALMKIANDARWYACGPRAGFAELKIPENEPGSSIMPGKINPTQWESLTMVAVQVLGNDHAVAFTGSQGNVYKPVILHNVLGSIRLLAEAAQSFDDRCVKGIEPNEKPIREHLDNPLELVTALNPHIGYEKAAQISLKAYREDLTLREAALILGFLTEQQFDEWVRSSRKHGEGARKHTVKLVAAMKAELFGSCTNQANTRPSVPSESIAVSSALSSIATWLRPS